jgi:hypothetical protein
MSPYRNRYAHGDTLLYNDYVARHALRIRTTIDRLPALPWTYIHKSLQ